MKIFFSVINILFLAFCIRHAYADVFDECDGVDEGIFVTSWSDCNKYIYCDGDDSSSGECDVGEYFDSETQICDAAANVYCPLDDPDEEEPEDPEPEDPEPEPEPTTTMATTTTSTTTITVTGATSVEPVTIPPIVREHCPSLDDPNQVVLMPNNQSCSDYYVCYHGHPIEMHCTNQLHFNSYTGKCDFPENVQCAIDRPNANKCLPHITDFFPHPDKCNYFYYCIKGFLMIQQCPFYYGWDIEKRSCVQMSQAKCFHTAKRT